MKILVYASTSPDCGKSQLKTQRWSYFYSLESELTQDSLASSEVCIETFDVVVQGAVNGRWRGTWTGGTLEQVIRDSGRNDCHWVRVSFQLVYVCLRQHAC